MNTVIRSIKSESGHELFITVRPDPAQPLAQQALAFAAVSDALEKHGAWIGQERIYASAGEIHMLSKARARHYGKYDDGVSPTWLVGGPDGALRGVQVYAVVTPSQPQPLEINGRRCARLITDNGCHWITASALPTRAAPTREGCTRLAFEEAEMLLKQAGGDLTSVGRTWFHLDKILDWYPSFNDTRTQFFVERGLITPGSNVRLPASTGIGVRPADGAPVLMDMFALVGNPACPAAPEGCICKHQATGHQRSAYAYGSSFARAATVCTPAGRTVFVSGTAAIDPEGQTCHIGDIPGQIRMTIGCVEAILRDQHCSARDVVQAVAYCKTAEVEACFGSWTEEVPWPWITVRGDVCRDNLLFEVEIAACIGQRRAMQI